MAEELKASLYSNLLSSGLPELDYSTFKKDRFHFQNGVRAVLTRGTLDVSIPGVVQNRVTQSSENFQPTWLNVTASQVVVLKTINRRFADRIDEDRASKLLQYFEREAGIWRHGVLHSNILELYGYMSVPGETFPSLVSPYYPEGDLRSYVEAKRNRSLPAKQRIKLICDVARGLEFLHSLSPVIIHRDVRASNALVREENSILTAVLIDFGSAKLSDQELFRILNSSHMNDFAWSPPEYILHPDNYSDPTTSGDIWSLACTCFEVFTAMDPYPSWMDIEEALSNGDLPERPPNLLVSFGDSLWSFMERCWNLSPELRPSANEAVLQLAQLYV